jgi:hypothetical protein
VEDLRKTTNFVEYNGRGSEWSWLNAEEELGQLDKKAITMDGVYLLLRVHFLDGVFDQGTGGCQVCVTSSTYSILPFEFLVILMVHLTCCSREGTHVNWTGIKRKENLNITILSQITHFDLQLLISNWRAFDLEK